MSGPEPGLKRVDPQATDMAMRDDLLAVIKKHVETLPPEVLLANMAGIVGQLIATMVDSGLIPLAAAIQLANLNMAEGCRACQEAHAKERMH